MSGGGSGGGSGGIGGSAKSAVKAVGHGVSAIAKGVGNVVEGVAKTAKKTVETAVSIPASLLAPKQEVADYSDYYTSTGDNAADYTSDNSISYVSQSAQSTGADQYSEGEAGNSVSSTSILSGNNPGAVMLGKKALLGRK